MQVLIMYSVAGEDLRVVMTARGGGITMTSPIMWLVDGADNCNGNPYLVYGDLVAAFTGRPALSCSLNVFGCTSGGLENWA